MKTGSIRRIGRATAVSIAGLSFFITSAAAAEGPSSGEIETSVRIESSVSQVSSSESKNTTESNAAIIEHSSLESLITIQKDSSKTQDASIVSAVSAPKVESNPTTQHKAKTDNLKAGSEQSEVSASAIATSQNEVVKGHEVEPAGPVVTEQNNSKLVSISNSSASIKPLKQVVLPTRKQPNFQSYLVPSAPSYAAPALTEQLPKPSAPSLPMSGLLAEYLSSPVIPGVFFKTSHLPLSLPVSIFMLIVLIAAVVIKYRLVCSFLVTLRRTGFAYGARSDIAPLIPFATPRLNLIRIYVE